MRDLYIGIDCGTQGTKALLMDDHGNAVGSGYAAHALIERSNGAREQDPSWWVEALRTALKQALAGIDTSTVRAIGVSGQQHGLVVLDEHLQVIRPAKLWNDTETAPQNAEIIARLGGNAACLQRIGIIPLTGYTVSKLLWLQQNEPENFARIRHILLPHEYLNFWLTGQLCAEAGDASGTAFFDVRSHEWSREVLDLIDSGTGQLFSALPALVQANEPAGTILASVAQEFGLPADCLVSAGGGDNMMGAIGTGNVREGIVTISLGTSATVYSFRDSPSQDVTGCVAPFCSSSGGWLPLVCTMNATNVVTQTVSLLDRTVRDIDAALAATEPGCDGLTLLPFLNGERTPDLPMARGTLTGIATSNFTPDHLIRAAVEGVSFGILNGLEMILEGKQSDRIRLIGGGARSAAWRQLLADASGSTIEVPMEQEAGCLGAAMQALYLHRTSLGHADTLSEIADLCVKLDTTKTVLPDPGRLAAYHEARRTYNQRLRDFYGTA
ncbi:xylulokinase [Granulicella paludicola]|uniref:xylulokinase n=1 Tax=Granulicella paludicola TaxID=474951 RepID=UPI0021DFB705|nr:xylulokinase [Granulicella paludicola]